VSYRWWAGVLVAGILGAIVSVAVVAIADRDMDFPASAHVSGALSGFGIGVLVAMIIPLLMANGRR
jgi:hypothetical protein